MPNWLAEAYEDKNVRDVGKNLMSPEARVYTRDRLPILERIDGKAEPDRLWRNLLSSQPLAFSIAGHLRAHTAEATELLAGLTQLGAVSLATLDPGPGRWEDHLLGGIEAEWFPPRTEHTDDMSGADIASCVALDDGRRVLVTIEVKYTDTFSAKPVSWSRYEEHLTALGLNKAAASSVVEAGCSQVLRQVMITDSVRRRGIVPGVGPMGRVDASVAVVLAREDDRTARRVVDILDDAVGSEIPVHFWSHRQLFTNAAKVQGLRGWAADMTERYVLAADSV